MATQKPIMNGNGALKDLHAKVTSEEQEESAENIFLFVPNLIGMQSQHVRHNASTD